MPIGRIGYLAEAMSDNRHAGAVLHQDGRPYGLNDFLTRLLLVPKYNLLLLALFFLGILFSFSLFILKPIASQNRQQDLVRDIQILWRKLVSLKLNLAISRLNVKYC